MPLSNAACEGPQLPLAVAVHLGLWQQRIACRRPCCPLRCGSATMLRTDIPKVIVACLLSVYVGAVHLVREVSRGRGSLVGVLWRVALWRCV